MKTMMTVDTGIQRGRHMTKHFVMRTKRKKTNERNNEFISTNKHGREQTTTKLKSIMRREGNTLRHIRRGLPLIFPRTTLTFRASSLMNRQTIVSPMAKRSGRKTC
eukprot:11589584-Heterocapsa_arctica.AAC.1